MYEKTLSKHHPLITRKITYVALYFLPTKKFLIDIMCKQDYDTVHDLVDDVTAEGQTIYDVAQKLYEENNLLDIPWMTMLYGFVWTIRWYFLMPFCGRVWLV